MLHLSSYLPTRETAAKWTLYAATSYFIYQSGIVNLLAKELLLSIENSLPAGAPYPKTYEQETYGVPCSTATQDAFQALFSTVDGIGRRVCFNATGLAAKAMQALKRETTMLTPEAYEQAVQYAKGVVAGLRIAPPPFL